MNISFNFDARSDGLLRAEEEREFHREKETYSGEDLRMFFFGRGRRRHAWLRRGIDEGRAEGEGSQSANAASKWPG